MTAKRIKLLAALLLAGIAAMICLAGCKSIGKATQQVLTDSKAFNQVGATWARLNPCVVDSVKTLVHDTTNHTDTLTKAVHDTTTKPVYINGRTLYYVHDTLFRWIMDTAYIHDSVKVVAVDQRAVSIYEDSCRVYAGQYAAAVVAGDGWKDKARARMWILIVAGVLAGAYIFRGPLLGLLSKA